MLEVVEEHIQREMAALAEQRQGVVMLTVGKVLLWMDLFLVCFVYVGLRAGSYLFWWWVLGEGVLGFALMGVGYSQENRRLEKTRAEIEQSESSRDTQGMAWMTMEPNLGLQQTRVPSG